MENQGVLHDKLAVYYKDVNLQNYREDFSQAVAVYQGKKFSRILDIGGGVGSFGDATKPFGFEYNILEASDYGVKECRRKNYNCKEFMLENGKKLPFEDNSISMVYMGQVLEHLDKETGEFVLSEIMRVLESGGVAIIKSPSKYSRIWETDPHHIYCWKPNDLRNYVKSLSDVSSIKMARTPLEPWMAFKYNERIIDTWHKYNKYPRIKKVCYLFMKALDLIIGKTFDIDIFLAVSNLTIVKK